MARVEDQRLAEEVLVAVAEQSDLPGGRRRRVRHISETSTTWVAVYVRREKFQKKSTC